MHGVKHGTAAQFTRLAIHARGPALALAHLVYLCRPVQSLRRAYDGLQAETRL